MTNLEAEKILREIGKLRVANKITLYHFDAWFLFGISNRIYRALVLTKQQQKYMLLILYKIKNNTYLKKKKGDIKMQRPIEFRCFDLKNKIMIQDVSHIQRDGIVVMQYTGLKDKHRVKIFEGDLIINELGHIPGFSPMPQVVEYRIYNLNGFIIAGYQPFNRSQYLPENSVVIGNVFENPEIVKELVNEYSYGFSFNEIAFDKNGFILKG